MEKYLKTMNLNNIVKPVFYNTNIRESINKKFVGQEDVCNKLFDIITRHKMEGESNSFSHFSRAVILDGASGTGKKAMIKEITQELDIPCVNWNINYGISINFNEILAYLYKIAKGNLEKAECGIVVLNQFEKVLYNPTDLNKMEKIDLQLEIVNYLIGRKYKIEVEDLFHKIFEIEFDTSRLMFIYNSDLLKIKRRKENANELLDVDENQVSLDDFKEMGLEKVFHYRIRPADVLHTKKYSKDDLLNILTKSTISPLLDFENWIKSFGKSLVVKDGVYERIASIAFEMGGGARTLEFLMHKIKMYMLYSTSLFFEKNEINLNLNLLDKTIIGSGAKDITSNENIITVKCSSCGKQDKSAIEILQVTYDALKFIASAPAKKIFSFNVPEDSIKELEIISKLYLNDKLEKEYKLEDLFKK